MPLSRARRSDLTRALAWGAVSVVLAVGAGYAATAVPELFHLEIDLSFGLVFGTLLGLGGVVAILRSPRLALVVLLLFVYLNLSEVLVRFHDLPSLLQLLVLPVAVSAVLAAGPRGVEKAVVHPLTWLLASYVVLLVASTTWAWDQRLAWAESIEAGKCLVLFLLVVLLASSSRKELRLAVVTLFTGGFLLGSLSLFQVLRGEYSGSSWGLARVKQAQIYGDVFEPRIAGPLGDPNYYAQILLMVVPFALITFWRERSPWRKGASLTAAVVVVAAILLTYSRGAAVALLVVLGLTVLVRGVSRRELLVIGALVTLILVLAPSGFRERLTTLEQVIPGGSEVTDPDSSFAKRRLVTLAAWKMFLDHPLRGVGAGNYAVRFDPYGARVGSAAPMYDDPGEAQYPHNLYLEVAAETGAVGLVLFGLVLVTAFGSLARAWRRLRPGPRMTPDLAAGVGIALAGYSMTSLFLHGHYQRYLWILLALAAAWDLAADRDGHELDERLTEAAGDAA